ncbi:MAG: glycerophosphodiester phosphodiesterase, partial [Pyrinomonadaceae bacterium]
MNKVPLIIGHRGASAHAPENTLAALRMAVNAGADGVEFDVQLAKDGVPVVIHDPTLDRTCRREGRIADHTSVELGKMDAGSWFNDKHPEAAHASFSAETVPTLLQVLELLTGYEGSVYVELKADDSNYRQLTGTVCDVIRHSPLLPQMIVKSFKLAAITEVRCLFPHVQTAALFAPQIMDFLRRRKHIVALAREVRADQISLHRSLA